MLEKLIPVGPRFVGALVEEESPKTDPAKPFAKAPPKSMYALVRVLVVSSDLKSDIITKDALVLVNEHETRYAGAGSPEGQLLLLEESDVLGVVPDEPKD